MVGSNLKGWSNKKWGYAKTCPASRHAAMIANSLRHKSKDGYGKMLRDAGFEPDHMADSIESAVISLWKARRFLEWDSEARDWLPPKIEGEAP